VKNVTIASHPLIDDCLARLRDEATSPESFRRAAGEAAMLLAYEVTRDFEQRSIRVITPVAATRAKVLKREVLLVPILRAGLGMLDSLLSILPRARVGMIGLKRDEETLQPIAYKESLPARLGRFEIVILDPMLATGGSAVAALRQLYQRGAKRVRLLHLLAAPAGVQRVHEEFPDVAITVGALDRELNAQGYIVPGLGDAGDRLFGV